MQTSPWVTLGIELCKAHSNFMFYSVDGFCIIPSHIIIVLLYAVIIQDLPHDCYNKHAY